MHGWREGEDSKQRRHMWPVPAARTAAAPIDQDYSDSFHPAPDSFVKDGRKVQVGDCALFQSGNAPPFIGIIRSFATRKDDYLKLCVNWLYRPADIKLAKGILLEAAPNEVFYSFHKDVISAASLLHPCKVAFLRKGVELPSGLSSFVCRRVYDIEHKCLWWLTDQDYINERQEEVDRLLDKTRLEMHGAVQSGGRSPKPLSSAASTQQVKSGSDSVQNSSTSFSSQVKGKKRDRGDQGADPIKRERSTKPEDGDSINNKLDIMIKAEISKITEKGGLTSTEGVEKLVHLMQFDRSGRKIDLAGRALLADVIAATDRLDCLGRFLQLRGVPVLDDWLQEAHKGKTGDGSSPKENDKAVEELLLALLRALDKLPVNLNALQTCNIGKSVNHLRTHKNVEIQRKARSLVDTWKKRVDAEIKINEAKSVGSNPAVTWPGKPGFSEVSQSGNRRAGLPDMMMKNSIAQPSACRTLTGKVGHPDSIVKSTSVLPGSLKLPSSLPASVAISCKDSLPKASGGSGISDLPHAIVKEERSSSSSHSQNNSQTCSSDHAKTVGSSWKEDAGSMNASKSSGGSSRQRKPSNGFLATGVQKETSLGKSGSLNRTATLEKVSQGERTHDMSVADHGINHRLIVRLPNPGRSPVKSSGASSFEDPSAISDRASPPAAPDDIDNKPKQNCAHIATDATTDSWQSEGAKEQIAGSGSDVGGRPSATIHDGGAEETNKATEVSGAACSSLVDEKGVVLTESKARNSLSSMDALLESCAKYSEPSASLSAGDDIGMNLLASVAAGEISKSNIVSPAGSPGSSPSMEGPCNGNDQHKPRPISDADRVQIHGQSDQNADAAESEKHLKNPKNDSSVLARDELHEVGTGFSGDKKGIMCLQETGEQIGQNSVLGMKSNKTADSSDGNLERERCVYMCGPVVDKKEEFVGDGASEHQDKPKASGKLIDGFTAKATSPHVESLGNGSLNNSSAFGGTESPVDPSATALAEQQPAHATESRADNIDTRSKKSGASSASDKVICSESADSKTRDPDEQGPIRDELERKELPSGSVIHDSRDNLSPKECSKSAAEDDAVEASLCAVVTEPDVSAKLDFDLNEGIPGDDANQSEPPSAIHLPFASSPMRNGSPALITVAAKGPFVPPENLLKSKAEPGWKGSAATSAFRPAEPRKLPETKRGRTPLDIDLNVPDERFLEDMISQSSQTTAGSESGVVSNSEAPARSSGGLGLDLNRADEATENGQFFPAAVCRLDVVRPTTVGESAMFRDFDLNNGPVLDDLGAEFLPRIQHGKNNAGVVPFLPPVAGLRMSNAEFGSVSSWFPPGNSYPAVAIPSFLPDRDHPYQGSQRIMGSVAGRGAFGGDFYRGPVLSSSPAMAFSPATAYPYPGFPFGSNFPVPSTSFSGDPSSAGGSIFPAVPSQLIGPVGAFSSNYPRPYVLSLPEGGGSESSRKWGRQGLDLNAGPGGGDMEVKDDRVLTSRQQQLLPVAGSQAFVEEQARMYQIGAGLKRKEPEGTWDSERFAYKQHAWQQQQQGDKQRHTFHQ